MENPDVGPLTDEQRVDEAGAESFPASDPPSWTAGLDRPEDDAQGTKTKLRIVPPPPKRDKTTPPSPA